MFEKGFDNNGSMLSSWNEKDQSYGRLCLHAKGGFDIQSCEEPKSSYRYINPKMFEGIDSSEASSPLGLTLTKTPSLTNQIERLVEDHHGSDQTMVIPKIGDSESEKLRASNSPATLLKIGHWKKISMREGDLVAKCYYAKCKLVWELLEGPLKSKIELQWLDIIAIRASICEHAPAVLEIELKQPPSFFREINPQPRKHTFWQKVSDFTRGQASVWRRHYVTFGPGMLDKHYEKLLQCDQRLYHLSKMPFPSQEFPYFHGLESTRQIIHLEHLALTRVQNLKQAALHHHQVGILDSNSPISVMDFARKNALWDQELNYVSNVPRDNYVQGVSYNVDSETQPNLPFQSQDYDDRLLNQPINPDMQLLRYLENHLLDESDQVVTSNEELLAKVKSMCSETQGQL